ncbi:MAG TPA: hypothetical protein VGP31_03495 [Planosporangium sp.]|nr:hypothetical protein [Planosporangium sp.]
MRPLALLLTVLPAATLAAASYSLRPTQPVVGAKRLAVVRAAVVVGAYAVVSVEVLSAVGLLTRAGAGVVWVAGLVTATAGAVIRHRRDPAPPQRTARDRFGPVELLMVAAMALLAAGTLVVALAARPNNWDSQAYHLPKVEQWVATGSVAIYPTNSFTQAAMAPGAEYMLLYLRLMTGGDALYNMVQWAAAVLCALAVSRVAAQLHAGRPGQVAAAFLVVSTPMVVLQATSTQTDLVAAAWCACVATLAVDAAWRRLGATDVPLLGAGLGMAVMTKSTGAVAAGLLLALWFVAQAWRARRARSVRAAAVLAGAALGVAAIAAVIAGPFLARVTTTYGSPLGPPGLRAHAMQRHGPTALTLNAARLLQTAALVPDDEVNALTARGVQRLARTLGADVSDPGITLGAGYPVAYRGPDEDLAPFPIQVAAVGAGLAYCLLRRRRDPPALGYALAFVAVTVAIVGTVKWQVYVNRLLLPGLAVGAPMAGLALDALALEVMARHARTAASRAVVTVGLATILITAAAGGADAVLFGHPRPLLGPYSVLTAQPWATRFARAPIYRPDYEWAAATVRAAGAHRVGMVVNLGRYEYPLWLLLADRRLLNLESDIPGHPAAPSTSVDAIVCLVPGPPDCAAHVPAGWTLRTRTYVAVALPPAG